MFVCQKCQKESSVPTKFCSACGGEVVEKCYFCPHCLVEYDSNTKFCNSCGNAVEFCEKELFQKLISERMVQRNALVQSTAKDLDKIVRETAKAYSGITVSGICCNVNNSCACDYQVAAKSKNSIAGGVAPSLLATRTKLDLVIDDNKMHIKIVDQKRSNSLQIGTCFFYIFACLVFFAVMTGSFIAELPVVGVLAGMLGVAAIFFFIYSLICSSSTNANVLDKWINDLNVAFAAAKVTEQKTIQNKDFNEFYRLF